MTANLEHRHSIDPFSASYWPASARSTKTSPAQNTKAKFAEKTIKAKDGDKTGKTVMPPPPPPSKARVASELSNAAPGLIPAQDFDYFKAAVMEFKFLAKSALLPTLKKKFDKCTKAQLTATLEHVAEKHGRKDWELKPSA